MKYKIYIYNHGNNKIIQKYDDDDKLEPEIKYRSKMVYEEQWFGHKPPQFPQLPQQQHFTTIPQPQQQHNNITTTCQQQVNNHTKPKNNHNKATKQSKKLSLGEFGQSQ